MENSVAKAGGVEISKKIWPSGLKSPCKPRVSREGHNKGKTDVGDDDQVRKKKRKIRKEVALSSFEPAGKKSRNSVVDGIILGNLDRSLSGLSQKVNSISGLEISLNLDDNGNVIHIPKGRRGSVGHKKFESNHVSKPSGSSSSVNQIAMLNGKCKKFERNQVTKPVEPSDSKASSVDQIVKLNSNSVRKAVSPKVKRKNGFDDFKENRTDRVRSAGHVSKEGAHLVVNNGDGSSRKRLSSRWGRKDLASGSQTVAKKVGPSVDNSVSIGDGFDDLKENRTNRVRSARHANKEEAHLVVNNGDGSSRKRLSSLRRRKDLASGSETGAKNNSVSIGDGFDDLKGNMTDRVMSARHAKKEGIHLVVNNGDGSSRKLLSSHRRRKEPSSGSQTVAKEVEPSVGNSVSIGDDSVDDDEENLEQNAARMLSSRFDPSCTVFSSKSISSASPSPNGSSFLIPSSQDFGSRGLNLVAGSESASADTASRVLRPRKQHEKKGLSSKRRHFYEVISKDLDAFWFLNRRIKVFWPLDESWYYGVVTDYDPERKLHNIKYDDRDVEWISLQNERFKLLLLPSEVPDKAEPKEYAMGDMLAGAERRDLIMNADTYMGSHMDSELIISWLVRSSHRVKSSPSGALKKQKTSHSHLSPTYVPASFADKSEDGDTVLLERDNSKADCNSAVPDRLSGGGSDEKSLLECTTISKESKLPVVYFRRRFRMRSEGFGVSVNKNACGSAPASVTNLAPVVDNFQTSKEYNSSIGLLDPDKRLWLINNAGLSMITMALIESKQFRFELPLPLPPLLEYPFGAEVFWLFRTVLLLQYGTIVTTWPKVHLELLFVDNIVGLRFFLFEGCLKQAVAFVFFVLTVFRQPIEQGKYADLELPVTSIRFKLSSSQDIRKQHVLAYYIFSKVKYSNWLHLDCKLQRYCLLTKQLPLPECTYDNIKALEGGKKQLHTSAVGWETSSENLQKQLVQGIMPVGVYKESCHVKRCQSSSNSDVKHGILPPFALPFTAAPTLLLSLHLKLLMKRSVACISIGDHNSVCSLEHSGNTSRSTADDRTPVEYCSENATENTPESNPRPSLTEDDCSGWLSCAKPQLGTDAVSVSIDGGCVKSSQHLQSGKLAVAETSKFSNDPGNTTVDVIVRSQKWECNDRESEQVVTLPHPLVRIDHVSSVVSSAGCYSSLNGLSVEIPPFDQVETTDDGKTYSDHQASDLAWNMSDGIICSPNPPRSLWHHNRNGSSSSVGDISHAWPDGKTNFICDGIGTGPKKPRTQVQYTLPFGGFDYSSKYKLYNQNGLPYKRIRRANEKRSSDGSRRSQRNLELLACDANVLITLGDRGWRECGARVFLELVDHNEWKLAVKLSGITKYSYKVCHVLQPGSTNRYTHAMMWKGGKDWALEFPDRNQWMFFKEMHKECHNRNIRAALSKNIPIPSVCPIEESDDDATVVPIVRSSPKYFRQVDTDVDMAMDPSNILYDMDSDDDQWILRNRKSLRTKESKCQEISDELFEKTMDMFEKVAYDQQRDHFAADEIEDLMVGVGPMEMVKVIYEHWQQKRQRNGMPLIRQLQPPLWERYQQHLKEWEQSMAKSNAAISSGCQEKAPPIEKPPMFAFCLKPRGLEVLNKGSKHRPQRKFSVSGHSHAILGDHDVLHASGRRLNGFAFGDERIVFPGNSRESSDASPLLQASSRVYSPRDAGSPGYFSLNSDASEWNHHPKIHRDKSKKIGTFLYPRDSQMVTSYNQRTISKRNGVHRWNMGLPERPSHRQHQSDGPHGHDIAQVGGSDLDEFRLHDASGAAQHALNMAKLKRENAQRLLCRADLAIHKAVVALMTAEAIKASYEGSNGDG